MRKKKEQFKIQTDIAVVLFAILICSSSICSYASTDLSPITITPNLLKKTEINTSSANTYTPKINLDIINQDFLLPKNEVSSLQEHLPEKNTNFYRDIFTPDIEAEKIIEESLLPSSDENILNSINSAFEQTPVEQIKDSDTNTQTPELVIEETAQQETPPDINTTTFPAIIEEQSLTTTKPSQIDFDYNNLVISQIEISGLKTISEEDVRKCISTDLNSKFNSLSLEKDLQAIYDLGYFSNNISIQPEYLDDGTLKIIFELEENRIVNNVIFKGNTIFDSDKLSTLISSIKNKPQNIETINESIDTIIKLYNEKGYILANISSVDDDDEGTLTFSIQEGVINSISFEGNEITKDYVISRNILSKAGDVYNEDVLKQDLQRVYAVQIFDDVTQKIEPAGEDNGKFDVIIQVKESKNNTGMSFGAGIDSALGVFGEIGLRDNNFKGRAQKVSLSGLIGSGILLSDTTIKNRINYQAELNFFEPYFLNADNSLASKLYIRELGSFQIPLAIERRIGLNTQIQHNIKDLEHLKTTFDAGVEHINLREGDRNRIYSLYAQKGINISERAKQLQGGFFVNLAPGIYYNNLDSEINPRNGVISEAKVIESIALDNIHHSSTRIAGSVTKFLPVAKKSSLALTAKGGARIIGDDMPEIMAYRLGGPYTIRGFRNSGVGSGNAFLMGSAELSTPIFGLDRLKYEFLQRMRLSFFVDAGQIFDKTLTSVLYDRPMHAITIGVGLKMYIPGCGYVSVDYGLPITNVGDYNSQKGYFTFGSGSFGQY